MLESKIKKESFNPKEKENPENNIKKSRNSKLAFLLALSTLFGTSVMSQQKIEKKDNLKPETENTIQKNNLEKKDIMSITGEGKSIDLSTAKKLAIMDAKKKAIAKFNSNYDMSKGKVNTNEQNVRFELLNEEASKDSNGNFIYKVKGNVHLIN